jgi:hypothetical protein
VLTGDEASPELEQNFQFEEGLAVELTPGGARAHAPGGARLLVQALAQPLAPAVTIGDRTPRRTYSDQSYAPAKPRPPQPLDFPYGRGWVARRTNTLYPAPALTYSGRVRLPAVLTMALVPSPPGADADAAPAIACATRGARTTWRLPLADGGHLLWMADAAGCATPARPS